MFFVYNKQDTKTTCTLHITHCTFIEADRTADYTITAALRQMLSVHANKDDIIGLLYDRNVPGDEITYSDLADEILANPPQQGYLTISNALQWRLQYKRVIELNNSVGGSLILSGNVKKNLAITKLRWIFAIESVITSKKAVWQKMQQRLWNLLAASGIFFLLHQIRLHAAN